ncbi:hypothetical protein Pmani_019807 [Petrolisthes manimaculis]|uniref:Uncharacterized protein n=1 Tax=Petrolisthes manimaculis TaxID=1843537 RepID=A0AAE1PIW4_9EUCA|nr:hypothetical protein Pmani_019807 [Petrolisthes manimaculis]
MQVGDRRSLLQYQDLWGEMRTSQLSLDCHNQGNINVRRLHHVYHRWNEDNLREYQWMDEDTGEMTDDEKQIQYLGELTER